MADLDSNVNLRANNERIARENTREAQDAKLAAAQEARRRLAEEWEPWGALLKECERRAGDEGPERRALEAQDLDAAIDATARRLAAEKLAPVLRDVLLRKFPRRGPFVRAGRA